MIRRIDQRATACPSNRVRRLVVGLLVMAGASVALEATALGGPPPGFSSPGRHVLKMLHCGQERRVVVHVPKCGLGQGPMPLVVALHGSNSDAGSFLDEANWAAQAERCGFVVIAPEGLPLKPDMPPVPMANPRVWNSGQYKSYYPRTKIDDVSFIVSAIDEAARCWPIDLRRVYVAGYSNGGAMAFRAASERADRFTAMASVSGLCWIKDPRPSRSIPTLLIHGTLDPLVPVHGGVKVLPWEISASPPVGSVAECWATAIGCPPVPTPVPWSPCHGVSVKDYGPGHTGGLLRVYTVEGQGHGWPGGRGVRVERLFGPDLANLDAAAAAWAFFEQWSW